MSSIDTFKSCIIDTIPLERPYKLYVYDSLGSILFKDEWEKNFKIFKGETKFWGGLSGYLGLIKKLYPNKEEELINYIFSKVSQSLCKMDYPKSSYHDFS